MTLLPVHGFVLAGGRSSRMGTDKSLLRLSGKPLIEHALLKLSRVCERVSVLGSTPELASYGPLVPDVHAGCGPIAGIEAALQAATFAWSLVLPVDVPFVPTALLSMWAKATVGDGEGQGTRLSMWSVEGRLQPAMLMLHRDLLPFVQAAIGRGEFKLLPMLEEAARRLGEPRDRAGSGLAAWRVNTIWAAEEEFTGGVQKDGAHVQPEPSAEVWRCLTKAQREAKDRWFANLNTPEEFAEAERCRAVLDT